MIISSDERWYESENFPRKNDNAEQWDAAINYNARNNQSCHIESKTNLIINLRQNNSKYKETEV